MPPICLPLSRVRTLGRSLWRSPTRKHCWPATACHNGFVAWPAQSCSPGSAPILRASTKLDRFVILRCEFVFSLQDFVALLWSAQAAALQRARWGVILLLVAARLLRELCVHQVDLVWGGPWTYN